MSHPEQDVFSIEMPGTATDEQWDEFQKIMDAHAEATNDYVAKLAVELGIPEGGAFEVWYLRGRSRWNQELEDRLIAAWKAGHSVYCGSGGEEEQLEALGF